MTDLTGINLSHWNGPVDFTKLTTDFVLLKVGGSDDGQYTDSAYASYAAGVRALGKPLGHWWFNGTGAPASDAAYFVGALQQFQDGDLCILDVEGETGIAGIPWTPSEVLSFLNAVATLKPTARLVVYMSASVTRDHDWTEVAKLAGLWVASYGADDGTIPTSPPDIHYWTSYLVWQYTQFGAVPGIGGWVNLNLAPATTFPPPPVPTKAKSLPMYIKTTDGKIWAINPIAETKHHITSVQWSVLKQFDHETISVTDDQAAAFSTV